MVNRPNVRSQDGPKAPLLCDECEGTFAAWEKAFSEAIFQPIANHGAPDRAYGDWFAAFGASVCWRVLNWARDQAKLTSYETRLPVAVPDALERWRGFLLAPGASSDDPDIHFLPPSLVRGAPEMDVPPNLHRYLMRAVDVEVITGGEHSHFVYAKLGPILVLGFIRPAPEGAWEGSKIAPKGGRLPDTYAVPGALFNFVCDRAKLVLEAQRAISSRQGERIADAWRGDPDRSASSATMDALIADVETFGPDAVFRDRPDPGVPPDTKGTGI